MKAWFVIGEDNLTSWSDEPEGGERFKTLNGAVKRAEELAESEPGKSFLVCTPIMEAICRIEPVTVRKA